MSEVRPMMHPKFSFRRMGVRWVMQLPTSFQEYNEAQHIKWKTDPLAKVKETLIKSPNANQVLKKLYDIVAKCEPFWCGKIARFGYDFTARFGGDFSIWKNRVV